jgi:seryl-tRNA synthetase
MLELNHKKLYELLEQKEVLVKAGRKISSEIETLQHKITKYQDKEKKITEAFKVPELDKKIETLGKEVQERVTEMEKILEEIKNLKLSAIPADMKKEHLDLIKQREGMERDRNKIALKIQKIKDKVVPIIHKEVKPLLKEYDDIETAQLEKGKVVIKTFNHLENWKQEFRNKKQ